MIPHKAFYPYSLAETLLRSLAVAALLVAGVLALLDSAVDDRELTAQLEATIQADFDRAVAEIAASNPQQLVSQLPGAADQGPLPPSIHLKLDPTGELLAWSHHAFVPPPNIVQAQLASPRHELLVTPSRVYFNYKTFTDSAIFFSLLPLKIDYPLQNTYLQDFVYLGRYTTKGIELSQPMRRFSLRPVNQGVNLHDTEGRHLFSLQAFDLAPFRHNQRAAVLWLGLASWVLGLGALYLYLRRRVKRQWVRRVVFIGATVGVRALLWAFSLPRSYISSDFFSPQLLAFNSLTPSLGDLTLNALVLLVVVVNLYYLKVPLTKTIGTWVERPVRWWAFHMGLGLLAALLFAGFFRFFEGLALNSKTHFEFADPYKLSAFSLLLFLSVALVLLSVFLVLHFLLGISQNARAPRQRGEFRLVAIAVGLPVVVGLLGSSVLLPMAFAGLMVLLFVLRERAGASLQFSLVNSLLLIAGLAALTNFAITRSLKTKTFADLAYYTQKFAAQQDWLTEYIFDEVTRTLADDSSLWLLANRTPIDTTAALEALPARIVNQHLANHFQGYDYQVAVYDTTGRRISGPTDTTPDSLGNDSLYQSGQPTLSTRLVFLQSQRAGQRSSYLGRMGVDSSFAGPLTVRIELQPKAAVSGQLYPQLLVDQGIRQQMRIPADYPMALYRNRRLARRSGTEPFPTYLASLPSVGETQLEEREGRYVYTHRLDEQHVVLATAPGRNFFDRVTAFSFLFYFFVLLYGVYSIPLVLERAALVGFTPYAKSFSFRIQFFMALVSIVPLLVLWLLISPRFTRLYVEDAEAELRQGLQQVSDYLSGESGYLTDLNRQPARTPSSSARVTMASNLLATDLNVFNLSGRLQSTSRPKLYQIELSSTFMNPEAYRRLATGERSELILVERIGGMEFLSGYSALMAPNGQVLGFLNLPWLSKQGLLESQVRSFAAYLVNLYVIIMIGVIVGGFFLSKSLTNPLRLLKQKLDQTNLGMPYEQLEWQSKDEIGAIIASYNQMLHKLERQEQKLAQTERELAWREMARQVAHEIKNPLTPMKLSIQHLMRMLQRNGTQNDPALRKVTDTLLTQIDSLNSIASSFSMFATMPQERHNMVELQTVVEQACELHLDAAEAEITWEMPESPLYMLGDPNQVTRILVNLIRNAMQAMEHRGLIHVRLYEEGTRATVSISDNGKGIPISIQSKIFEPNFSTKTSGMGLGLAITRRLVENMDGSITFESEVGVGTTFYIRFPIILPEPEVASELQLEP